ncbi:MAG TPA: transposase [Ktedonobacterales bacterium]|nr:transposase [Ktedonobacterales bacterium]
MRLVEQHRIDRADSRFAALDAAAFASKNLYNATLYQMRQQFIADQTIMAYGDLDTLLQPTDAYKALPAKVAQWVLKQVCFAWSSYRAAVVAYRANPAKFLGHPKLPKYLEKQGRNLLTYTEQAISKVALRDGFIVCSGVAARIATQQPHPQQVRIVPHATHYTVEVIYEADVRPADLDPTLVAGVDLGINNLATITSNHPGFTPLLVNGRPLKALNQWYNQRRAHYQAQLPNGHHTSRRLDLLADKRNRQINYYLHNASRRIIEMLVQHQIGTLVIGKNDGWKQHSNLGKRTNQSFVQIPHARFIAMLEYKAALVGVTVHRTEESYTSKCSFLDGEVIGHHAVYVGKRVKRGLFQTAIGKQVNADVNGAYNIITKVVPDAFSKGRAGVVVHPVRLRLTDRQHVA